MSVRADKMIEELQVEVRRYKETNKVLIEALQKIADGQGKYADIAKEAIGQA